MLDDDMTKIGNCAQVLAELKPKVVEIKMGKSGWNHATKFANDVASHRNGSRQVFALDQVVAIDKACA